RNVLSSKGNVGAFVPRPSHYFFCRIPLRFVTTILGCLNDTTRPTYPATAQWSRLVCVIIAPCMDHQSTAFEVSHFQTWCQDRTDVAICIRGQCGQIPQMTVPPGYAMAFATCWIIVGAGR